MNATIIDGASVPSAVSQLSICFSVDLVIPGFYSCTNRVWDSMYFRGFLPHFAWLFWRCIYFPMNFLLEKVQSEC